jgi:hypothetical protein
MKAAKKQNGGMLPLTPPSPGGRGWINRVNWIKIKPGMIIALTIREKEDSAGLHPSAKPKDEGSFFLSENRLGANQTAIKIHDVCF